jgi:hypothetical protein
MRIESHAVGRMASYFVVCCFAGCADVRNWDVCNHEVTTCLPGYTCDLISYHCVPVVDGGTADGPISPLDGASPADRAGDMTIVDAPMDQPGPEVTADTRAPGPEVTADTRAPDAPGTCGANSDCPDPAKGFCVGGLCAGCTAAICSTVTSGGIVCATTGPSTGKCVECVGDGECAKNPGKGFCVSNVCTGCTAALCASTVDGGAAVCATTGAAAGKCVECVGDGDCTKDLAKGFCVNNACTGCTAALCTGKIDGGVSLVCATSGLATGQCVECVDNTGCTKDPARGFCVSNACTGCQSAGAAACNGARPSCATSGASAGQCVECIDNTGCTASAAKGFCVTNACTGCTAALCAGRTDGKTACAAAGTFSGQCVSCTSNSQCVGTTPICSATTDTCRACTTDSECSAIGPGVCMTDGHCAADGEAIYVGTLGSAVCSESNTGTAQAPVCTVQSGVGLAKSGSKPVVIIRGTLAAGSTTIAATSPLTIVGRNAALLVPAGVGADAITITSGDITLRNLTIQGTASPKTGIGINALTGTTLHMDTCAVNDNPGGGILLNGAAFDIKNTTVTGNGVGQTSGYTWGGILVQSLPATGSTNLSLVSIKNNTAGGTGLVCVGAIQGTGVLASGNTPFDINTTCAVTACTSASTTCGAQSTPQ